MTTDNPTDLATALAVADPGDRLLAIREVELALATLVAEARAARRETIAELRRPPLGLTWRVIGNLLGIAPNAAEQLG